MSETTQTPPDDVVPDVMPDAETPVTETPVAEAPLVEAPVDTDVPPTPEVAPDPEPTVPPGIHFVSGSVHDLMEHIKDWFHWRVRQGP